MSNRSTASRVDGRWARFFAVLICAAIITTVAAALVMRGRAARQERPLALAGTPPPAASGGPRQPVPSADEEGDRSTSAPRNIPGGSRLKPLPRSPQPGLPAARPHPPVPVQAPRPQTAPLARRLTAHPADPAPQPDPVRSAQPGRAMAMTEDPAVSPPVPRANPSTAPQGQAATSPASAAGAGGAGAGPGAGSGTGSGPATGGGDGQGGAAGPTVPSSTEPVQLVPPRVIVFVGTDYPGEAFRVTVARQDLGSNLVYQGTEGNVRVRALVRADGGLGMVEVTGSSGSAILDRAATDAVRRWVFAPAMRNGVPVDAYVTFTVRYVVR